MPVWIAEAMGRLTAEAAASVDEVEAWYNPWKNRTVLMVRSELVSCVDSVAAVVAHGGANVPAVDCGLPNWLCRIGIFKDEDFVRGARGWC
jgi:hypothetical protein